MKLRVVLLLSALLCGLIGCSEFGKFLTGDDAQAGLIFACHPHPDDWEHNCNVDKLECNKKAFDLPPERQQAALAACADNQRKCLAKFPPCNSPKQCLLDPAVGPNQYTCR